MQFFDNKIEVNPENKVYTFHCVLLKAMKALEKERGIGGLMGD